MRGVKLGIGLVGIVPLVLVVVATIRAQADERPLRQRERISRKLVDGGIPSVATPFNTEIKITASDGEAFDLFGAVDFRGDTVIVGARYNDGGNGINSGSAYVYRRDEGGINNWGEVTKITASDGAQDDRFGYFVAVSGDTAIVGAFADDDACANGSSICDSGSAYIYQRDEGGIDNWGEVIKITASDMSMEDLFGAAVDISGDTAIVGAPLGQTNGREGGSVYVFGRNQGGVDNWGEVTKITASDAAGGDQFGLSVSLRGDTVIVGAYRDDDNGEVSGSAYVYYRNRGGVDNWGEVTKITASDASTLDWFGISVAVSGDTAIVGASNNDDACPPVGFLRCDSGSAYIYQRDEGGIDNWGEMTKITASDAETKDRFGRSVAIGGHTVIVGAHGNEDHGRISGSAYVYQRDEGGIDNWGEVTKITASDAEAEARFGYRVATSGGTVLVGANYDDENGRSSGSAYFYFTSCKPETVGGAIYADCDAPLTSGEEGVEITLSGTNGVYNAMTSGPSGTWHIPDVSCGEYTVTPDQVFREYCHVDIGGECPPEPCETSSQITVDADHRSENLSIQFFGQPGCIINDLNYDEVCTIVFDTELFVQCVYGGDCVGPDGQDLQCPADCNCDGLATIVFDASCFMHNVYVKGICGECPDDGPANASERHRTAGRFTIGGAVYEDTANPLLSGIEGVDVQVFGAGRKIAATATTAGPSGIWRVDDLPAGTYTVVFEHRDGRMLGGRDVISIVVDEDNEAANLSIRLPRSLDSSRVPSR